MIQTKVTLAYVDDLNMKVQIKDHQNKSLQISDKELVKGCSVESYIHKEHPFVIFGDCQLFLNFQPKKEKILTQRAQSFTSFMADLRQDINRVS